MTYKKSSKLILKNTYQQNFAIKGFTKVQSKKGKEVWTTKMKQKMRYEIKLFLILGFLIGIILPFFS
jgi:hypothetical protein